MGGGEINLATLANALSQTNDTKVSILTSSAPNLPEIENPLDYPNLTIYRRLNTGSSPSSFLGNISRFLFLKHSIITQTKKILNEQSSSIPKIDILHFIGGTIIAAPELKQHLNNTKQDINLFATIESYPTLCPKGDRWYKQQQPCTIKCTLPKFLTCQSQCTEIGKMKNAWYLKYNPFFLLLTYHYYHQRNTALSHCHLIAISKYVQNILQQQSHQSTIIPNILNTTPFEQAKKQHEQTKKETKTKEQQHQSPLKLLYLGSLIESKGPHIMLQALKDIPSTSYHLDLYGNGIMKPQLQQDITQYNLNATIHSPVPYQQISQLYTNTDIILFPSIWPEPFGRIPIEAHAAGKIVIASNIGAIPETVTPQDILIPQNDPHTLKVTLKQIINNKSHNLFKQQSKKTIQEQEYHPNTIITQLKKLYKQKKT